MKLFIVAAIAIVAVVVWLIKEHGRQKRLNRKTLAFVERELTFLFEAEDFDVFEFVMRLPMSSFKKRIVKRAFDVFVSLVLSVIFLPFLYIVLGILIKLESKGPIVYIQKRIGLHGEEFNIYKFRTMYMNSPTGFTEKNDKRITRVGRIIRALCLDEIPQLVNILKGDMSFVGPRPRTSYDEDFFFAKFKMYKLRYLVIPGLTGDAQIILASNRGNGNDRIFMASILSEIEYVHSMSLWSDIRQMLETIKLICK